MCRYIGTCLRFPISPTKSSPFDQSISGGAAAVDARGAAVQRVVDEQVTLHAEHTVARRTREHTLVFQLPLAGFTEPLCVVQQQRTLLEGLQGEEVVEGASQMRSGDKCQPWGNTHTLVTSVVVHTHGSSQCMYVRRRYFPKCLPPEVYTCSLPDMKGNYCYEKLPLARAYSKPMH